MQLYCEICKLAVTFEDNGSGQMICPECGHEVDRASMPPGAVLQGFKIEYEIGRGTSGAVYKAKQLNLDRDIALKVLHHEVSSDDEFVERFFREARAAASLSSPYIVQAIDAGAAADGDIYYFAMELIEGEDLEMEISRTGPLNPERGVEISLIVARAMEYAWERKKLTHGDIKPENILINKHGEAKLADLGLAKIGNDGSDELMATPMYAPPEIISGDVENIGMVSDIYSFGATVYHMFAGHPPFQEDDSEKVMDMHLYDYHTPLAQGGDFFSEEFSLLVDRMLEKDCDKRPASWTEIVKELEVIQKSLKPSSKGLSMPRSGFSISAKPAPPPLPKKTVDGQDMAAVATDADADAEKAPSGGKKNIVIALIIAVIAGVITVALLLVLSSKRSDNDTTLSSSGKSPSTAVKSGAFENPAKSHWAQVKKELEELDDDKKIAVIKAFNQRYKPAGDLKEEINQALDNIIAHKKQKLADAAAKKQRQENARKDFSGKINTLLAGMKEVHAGSTHEPIQLREMMNEAKKLIEQNRNNKLVAGVMDDETKQSLLGEVKRLDGRMKIAEARKVLINKKVARLHAELSKRNALERKLNSVVKVAGVNAGYYELLNQVFLRLRKGEEVAEFLKASQKTKLLSSQRHNVEVLGKMFASSGSIRKFFIKNEAVFAGLTVPGLSGSASTYKISKIKEPYLILLRPVGGAIMGDKKKWSEVDNNSRLALVRLGLEKDQTKFSTPDDIYQIFGWLLRNRIFKAVDPTLALCKGIDKKDKTAIVNVINDYKQAVLERAAWTVLKKMLILAKQQNPQVMELISSMKVEYSSTECYKKNRQIIDMLDQRYAGFEKSKELAQMFKQYLKIRKSNFPQATNLAATMSARYGMNKGNQSLILKVEKNLLGNISKKESIEPTMPFVMWNLEKPDRVIKYLAKDQRGRGTTGNLRLSAEIATGLWHNARLAAGAKDGTIFNESNIGRNNSESTFVSLLGVGIIAYRLGRLDVAERKLQKMIEMTGLKEAIEKHNQEPAELENGDKDEGEKSETSNDPLKVGAAPKGKTAPVPPPEKNVLPGLPGPPKKVPAALSQDELFPDEVPASRRRPARKPVARPAEVRPVKQSNIKLADSVKIQRRLTIEYAMLIKRYSIAATLGNAHCNAVEQVEVADLNIAMLHLLALIQSSKINPAVEFEKQLQKYHKLFAEKFADDIALCQQVSDILQGKPFKPQIIKKLRLSRSSDTCLRMLSSAFACSLFYGHKPYSVSKFANAVRTKVSDAFGSGVLWRSLLLLRLADPDNSLAEMKKVVDVYKRDRRVVAIYGYPELTVIDAGVEILHGNLPVKMILDRMKTMLRNSPASGIREALALREINQFSIAQLEKYLRDLKPEQQINFSLLFLGVMRSIHNKPAEAVEFISRNRNIMFGFELSWEEKLMIDNMMLWAIAWSREKGN